MRYLMLTISAAFHPLLMATYSCIIMYFTIPSVFSPIPYNAIPYFIIAVFLTTALIPVLSVSLMLYSKQISHYDIPDRKERKIPFITITLFYAITTYLMNARMGLSPTIFKMMLLVSSLIFLIFLISLKFKISVHSAAIWGVAGLFSVLSFFYYSTGFPVAVALIFIAAGLTTTARLSLGRHTLIESWSGGIVGFTFCSVGFFFMI